MKASLLRTFKRKRQIVLITGLAYRERYIARFTTNNYISNNVFLSLSKINLEAILTSASAPLQESFPNQIINSSIAILWPWAKNRFRSLYLGSNVGGTRKVSGLVTNTYRSRSLVTFLLTEQKQCSSSDTLTILFYSPR